MRPTIRALPRLPWNRFLLPRDCAWFRARENWLMPNKDPKAAYEQLKRWRAANPEKMREIERRYQEKNRDKIRETKRRYYEKNKQKADEQKRRWREENPEKIRVFFTPPALLLVSLLFVLLVIAPLGFPDLVPVLLLVPALDLAHLLRVSGPPALQLLICGLRIFVRHQPVLSRAEPCAVAREQEAIPWQSR